MLSQPSGRCSTRFYPNQRRKAAAIFFVASCFVLLYQSRALRAPRAFALVEHTDGPDSTAEEGAYPARCGSYNEDILLIIKTGATEIYDRVPTLLDTFVRCTQGNFLIFSDLAQELGPYQVHDALDEVSPGIKINQDFDLYRLQQDLQRDGVAVGPFLAGAKSKEAWGLDKYKNTHMARKTYAWYPNASWYVFIDADTFVFWPTLLGLLERLNPEEPLFLGTATDRGGGLYFAHGGSGYMLSGKSMEIFALAANDSAFRERYDGFAEQDCCGDVIFARAVLDAGGPPVHGLQPIVLSPQENPLGPDNWCKPLITSHHVSAGDVDDLWRFQLQMPDPSQPLLFSDFYRSQVEPQMRPRRDAWDNGSPDAIWGMGLGPDGKPGPQASFEDCGDACRKNPKCFQWLYREKTKDCHHAEAITIGVKQPLDVGDEKATSGWDVDKIRSWAAEMGTCEGPTWV